MKGRVPRRRSTSGCLVALLAVAACSCSAATSTSATTGGTGASSATSGAPSYEVTTRSLGSLGTVLVDGRGFTLYVFAPDNGRPHSTCYGVCTQGWPPLVLPAGVTVAVAGGEARQSLLGVSTRQNGTLQVTYAGWPLYRWANDTAPGEATGQALYNLGGRWYVIGADGTPVH